MHSISINLNAVVLIRVVSNAPSIFVMEPINQWSTKNHTATIFRRDKIKKKKINVYE